MYKSQLKVPQMISCLLCFLAQVRTAEAWSRDPMAPSRALAFPMAIQTMPTAPGSWSRGNETGSSCPSTPSLLKRTLTYCPCTMDSRSRGTWKWGTVMLSAMRSLILWFWDASAWIFEFHYQKKIKWLQRKAKDCRFASNRAHFLDTWKLLLESNHWLCL
jgi:hypothetical protein